MKKMVLFWVGLCLITGSLHAQNATVVGAVVDSADIPLPATTVVMLQAEDSVMYQFTITNNDGAFLFQNVAPGDYVVQLSYLGYFDRSMALHVPEGTPSVSLGRLELSPKHLNLGEFTVTGRRIPIVFRGDTIQYNADAYHVERGDVVEDLLQQLPGVTIDRDGTIRAQGEVVGKVLVDGKEFFGDDPALATKNLPADAIDNVEIFDKQSETAEFTGVEDGETTKTINLQLKEDKKSGYFGALTGGYGTEDRYLAKGNIHRFSPKTQLSVIGLSNNVNEQGFSFNDYINFMGGMSALMGGSGGGMMDIEGLGVPLNLGINQGFITTNAAGFNFNADLSEKTRLNTSYFYSGIRNDFYRESDRRYFTLDQNALAEEVNERYTDYQNHRFNYKLTHQINENQDLTFRGNLSYNDGFASNQTLLSNYSSSGMLESDAMTRNRTDALDWSWNGFLTYRKKFKKKGRYLVLTGDYGISDQRRDTRLNSTNNFWLNDTTSLTNLVDQSQNDESVRDRWTAQVSYTEPIGKRLYLEWRLSHHQTDYETNRVYFDVLPDDLVPVFNEALSTNYIYRWAYDRSGLSIKRNRKGSSLNVSGNVQYSRLDGQIIDLDTTLNRTFVHVLPALRWNRKFSNAKRLNIDYQTEINAPRVEQLQPVVDNSDPLNIYIGNPNLDAEYRHVLMARYIAFSQFNNTEFYSTLQSVYTENRISNAVSIDSALRQVITPVNVDYDSWNDLDVGFGGPIKKIKARFNLEGNTRFNRGLTLINDVTNTIDRWTNSVKFQLENLAKKKFDLLAGVRYEWTTTTYQQNSDLDQTYFRTLYFADLSFKIKKEWAFETSLDWSLYTSDAFSGTLDVPIWKAGLTRYFMEDQLRFKFQAVDILDRNQGINRVSQLNYIEEERIRSLGRYFMVSLSYSISGFNRGGGVDVEVNGDR